MDVLKPANKFARSYEINSPIGKRLFCLIPALAGWCVTGHGHIGRTPLRAPMIMLDTGLGS